MATIEYEALDDIKGVISGAMGDTVHGGLMVEDSAQVIRWRSGGVVR